MKKTFLLLIIVILISGFLASCTGTQMQLDADSDEELVEALKTKISSQSESSTDETATPFSQMNDGDENLVGKMRWTVEIDLPNHYVSPFTFDTYTPFYLPTVTQVNFYQQSFFNLGYLYDNTSFYLPSRGGRIVAVDIISGLEKWQSEIGGYVLAVGDDTVFVLTGEHRIYGLDKYNGEVKWKIILEMLFKEDTYISTASLMHKINDKYVLILQTSFYNPEEHNFWLMQIDENTGDYVFIQADPELGTDSDPFYYSENVIVVRKRDTFMGVNYEDGSIIWRITKPESYLDGGALVFVDMDIEEKILYLFTEVYSGEIHNVIYDLIAIDMMTGDLIWGGSIGEVNNSFGIGIFDASCDILEKYLVCGTHPFDDQNQDIYNIYDKNTGQFVNTFTPERWHHVYLSENGLIVEYSEVGIFQGIDYLTGEILWKMMKKSGIKMTAVILFTKI